MCKFALNQLCHSASTSSKLPNSTGKGNVLLVTNMHPTELETRDKGAHSR